LPKRLGEPVTHQLSQTETRSSRNSLLTLYAFNVFSMTL